jgi:NADPH:quinone reductase-like Zn-dependent oxidoreductase
MEAFAIDELGSPGSIRDLAEPEADEGQVRIRVAAAGLNPFDGAVVNGRLKGRMDHRFPLIPGMDASGTVEAVGDGVLSWGVGDDVFGSVGKMYLGEGTLAQRATMSAATIAPKPSSIDHASAAAIPIAGVTALMMADALEISRDDVVLAIGATGGVGSFFVQIVARRGAHLVAVCSKANAGYARSLGAADVIDYHEESTADALASRFPDGIVGIADMFGDKESLAALAGRVRSGGYVVSAVGAADARALEHRGLTGVNVNGMVTTASLEELAGMLERKELVVPELHAFPFADAAEALRQVGSGHSRGKIVVAVE